ncbi:MAG: hypothetical protein FWD28_04810 [Treponema sp.]|nr:hypothetical protein [Treponema sp.]
MKKKLLFLSVILVFVLGTVFAQNAQELRIGTSVNGRIDAGQETWFIIRTTQAGVLSIETHGNTDTYMELYDAQRNLIKENDDGGVDFNAKIEVVAARGTTYLVKVRGFSSDVVGSYQIAANMENISDLRLGNLQRGNIESGRGYWFRVRATSNGILTVETTGDTDTYLEIYDGDNNYITEDDDGGEGFNAKVDVLANSGSTYLVRLSAYGDNSGPYQIRASIRNVPAPTSLSPGSFFNGNIAAGQEYWFSVRTSARGRLVVETTGNTDTYLFAYSDSYELLAQDDDGGDGYNARIVLDAAANRTYLFRLRGYSTSEEGPYRIFASME